MLKIVEWLFMRSKDDPIRHCNVYKSFGCAHVDGMLCNMKTCDVEITIKVTPSGEQEMLRTGRYDGGSDADTQAN
jgi:hypothetical protein